MLAIDWLFVRPGRALLLAIAAIFAAHFAYVAILTVRDPYLLNYTEGISLMAANRVLHGEPLYPDINRFPFVYFAYPIVYPLVSSALVALLGNRLLGLRLLTIACELLLAVLIFRVVERETRSRFASALASALWLGLLAVHKFHGLARVDSLQLVLEFAAVDALLGWRLQQRRRWLLWGFALYLVAACLTKPTSLITLGACAGAAMLEWRARPADARSTLRAAALALLAYGGLVVLINWWTGGGFVRDTFLYQAQSGLTNWTWNVAFRRFFLLYWTVVILAGIALVLVKVPLLIRLLAVVSFAWFAFASFKIGADLNHSLQFLVLVSILAGLGLTRLQQRRGRDWLPVACVIAMAAGYFATCPAGWRVVFLREALASVHERAKLNELMRAAPGLTLSEEPFYAVANRKPFVLNDPFQMVVLAEQGRFDLRPVLGLCRSGRIRRVFVGPRLWGIRPLRSILERQFRPIFRGGIIDDAGGPWAVFDAR